MKNYLTIKNIKSILSPEELLSGNFGFEKEGLRVNSEGKLALTPHPTIFGDKLANPYITTDFSESQVEIVTPTFNSIQKAYQCLSFLVDIVNTSIRDDEFIWNQSLPCILPYDHEIPIAEYPGKKGESSRVYREKLAEKYGTKKQMISGIHYNYSLSGETIQKLYDNYPGKLSYKAFRNALYLKITRNYLRLKWFIIYVTGASVAAHETFTSECLRLMPREDGYGSYYSEHGPSYRNSHIGYKNLEKLYPRYDRLEHFLEDVKGYINDGKLSEAKELYTQIRLKPVDRDNYLESLYSDGIEYVEVRSIDINPFEKSGISRQDAEFVHLFMVYLLLLEEDESDVKWQEDALYNEEIVAENGFDNSIRLLRNGEKIGLRDWADEILAGMDEMNTLLDLGKDELIRVIRDRVEDEGKTYAKQLEQIVENRGFIPSQLSIAVHNKDTSIELIDLETIYNNVELEEVYSKSLPNRKD
ncbi:MAG: glutamate--cysteine ligase [Methanobrevibacter sp.]|nr:glutamate--cysteine ligase [Methanobrevibacter sp.]